MATRNGTPSKPDDIGRLAQQVDLLDSALAGLFTYRRRRTDVLAKSAGDDRVRMIDDTIEKLIAIREHRVTRIRAAGAGELLLAKIADSDRSLAKIAGIPRGNIAAGGAGRQLVGPHADARRAERAFLARIERTIAETRPDEYQPERR